VGLDDAAMRGVDNLVRNHLRITEGERALILHRDADALAAALADVIRGLGARVRTTPIEILDRDGGSFEARLREAVADMDAALYVSGDEGDAQRGAALVSTMESTGVRYLHATGLTPRALSSTLRAHPQQLRATNERLAAVLGRGGELTLRSPAGTDLRLRLDAKYPIVPYEGIPEAGKWESVPTGAVSVYPADASGTYVADRLLKAGELVRWGRELQRAPVTFHLERGRVVRTESAEPEVAEALEARFAADGHASAIGFVSIATNPLCLNELRTFSNDALLPGLRLMFGYSDPKKTGAPRSSPHWSTVLGRRHDLQHEGTPIVTAGRLERRWTA
tara:strand:- start:1000 stop:2004 length:1005 start_codon:yes stop_codon:yes gene_type:complete